MKLNTVILFKFLVMHGKYIHIFSNEIKQLIDDIKNSFLLHIKVLIEFSFLTILN